LDFFLKVRLIFERNLALEVKSKAFKTKLSQNLWLKIHFVDEKAKLLIFRRGLVTPFER